MKTIKDLKEYLQEILDTLEYCDEDAKLKIRCNTYGMGTNFLATGEGFIDLDEPDESEEDDYE